MGCSAPLASSSMPRAVVLRLFKGDVLCIRGGDVLCTHGNAHMATHTWFSTPGHVCTANPYPESSTPGVHSGHMVCGATSAASAPKSLALEVDGGTSADAAGYVHFRTAVASAVVDGFVLSETHALVFELQGEFELTSAGSDSAAGPIFRFETLAWGCVLPFSSRKVCPTR